MIAKLDAARKWEGLSRKLLFIHGACHGAWCWDGFVTYFNQHGYTSHAMNLRGHEKPGTAPDINRHTTEDYLCDVVAKVGEIGDDVVLVGHSMGGFLVQKYLERHKCAGAVLLASVPPSGMLRSLLRTARAHPAAVALSLCTRDISRFSDDLDKLRWAGFSDDVSDEEIRAYAAKVCGESIRALLGMVRPKIVVNHHTSVPMLVLGAENDKLFTVQEVEATAMKYGAACHIFPDMAHNMIQERRWLEVAEMIKVWIEQPRK